MRYFFSFTLTFLIGFFAYQSLAKNEPKQFSLTMTRTNCYGPCPVYELKADSSGKVEFEGVEFTETKGKLESRLSNQQIKLLSAEIQRSNFFSLENDYGYESKNCNGIWTDQSGVLLTIEFNGQKKTIDHYQGCIIETSFWQKNPLEKLSKFEDNIDEIIGTKQWIEGK